MHVRESQTVSEMTPAMVQGPVCFPPAVSALAPAAVKMHVPFSLLMLETTNAKTVVAVPRKGTSD